MLALLNKFGRDSLAQKLFDSALCRIGRCRRNVQKEAWATLWPTLEDTPKVPWEALGALNFIFLANKDQPYRSRDNHNQEPSQQAVEEVHQRGSHGCLTLFKLKVWRLSYKQFYRSVNRLRSVSQERILGAAANSGAIALKSRHDSRLTGAGAT